MNLWLLLMNIVVIQLAAENQSEIHSLIFPFSHLDGLSLTSEAAEVRKFLSQLFESLLNGHHVFLFYDESIEDKYTVLDDLLKETVKTFYIATMQKFCLSCYENDFFRQGFIVNVFIFYSDIEDFLNSLVGNISLWGPTYAIAISLNNNLDTSNILLNPCFQRSNYLFSAELTYNTFNSPIIETFIVKPYFHNETNKTLTQTHKLPRGIWNAKRKMNEIFTDRFHNFEGSALSLGSWCDDFPYLYDPHFNDSDICVGSNLDTLSLIGESLNFTLDIQYEPIDLQWGSYVDGNWTGMLADIKTRGKDMTINSFPVGEDKNSDFDFAYPYRVEGYGFLGMLPAPLPKWKGLLLPFSRTVWISTALSGVGAVIFMVTILKISSTNEIREDNSYIILLIFGSFFRQSWKLNLLRVYLKLWIGVWLLVALIITTAYTSNLISFLTVQLYPHRIETIEEIASAKTKVAMSNYGSFVPKALMSSQHKSLAAIGRKLDLLNFTGEDYTPAVTLLKTRTHILIETTAYLINLRRRFNLTSDTYILKDEVYTGSLAYYFPKNSPLRKPIGERLTRLIESGIANKLFWDHMTPALKPSNTKTEDSRSSLTLSHLMGCFFIVIFGWSIATLFFIIELLVNRNH